jgi:hypothetical protein
MVKSHRHDGAKPARAEASSQPIARSGTGGDRNRRRGAEVAPRILVSEGSAKRPASRLLSLSKGSQ